jgi:hypothetical protein
MPERSCRKRALISVTEHGSAELCGTISGPIRLPTLATRFSPIHRHRQPILDVLLLAEHVEINERSLARLSTWLPLRRAGTPVRQMSGACIPPLWLAAVNFRAMSGSAAVSQNRPQGDVASSSPANPSLLITMFAAIAEFERKLSTDERAAQAGDGRPPTVRPGSFVAPHPFARPTDPIARLARTARDQAKRSILQARAPAFVGFGFSFGKTRAAWPKTNS